MKDFWKNNKTVIIISVIAIAVLISSYFIVSHFAKKGAKQEGAKEAKEGFTAVVVNKDVLGAGNAPLTDAEKEKVANYVGRAKQDIVGISWGMRDTELYEALAIETDRVLVAVIQTFKSETQKDFVVELKDEASLNYFFSKARESLFARIDKLLTANA